MQKIALEVAGPEMVVAKPVTREDGVVLVAAGAVLTPALISRLDAMGVGEVVVEGDALDTGAGGGPRPLPARLSISSIFFAISRTTPICSRSKAWFGIISRRSAPWLRQSRAGGTETHDA